MLRLREKESSKKASKIRRNETKDLAERLLFLKAEQLEVLNYPIKPYKIFNATHVIEGDKLILFVRGIFDYYKYVSSIIKIELDLNDVLSKKTVQRTISGETIIVPDRIEDLWGAEDPRYFSFGDERFLAYTGRTKWYYENNDDPKYRTVTMIAVSKGDNWSKIGYLSPPIHVMNEVKSLKNCLIVRGKYFDYAPCRIHTWNKRFITVVGKLKSRLKVNDYSPIEMEDLEIVLNPANFEEKTGWGTPFLRIGKDEYLTLLHAMDKDMLTYRVFAALLRDENKTLELLAVTPTYIMEPKTIEEKYGDRPNVVFPCGLQEIDDDLLITYGAADTFVGIARLSKGEVIHELEKGRVL